MATRFQVRSASKKWTDNGPDLFRGEKGAERTLMGIVPREHGLETRVDDGEWKRGNRDQVRARFRAYTKANTAETFQVAVGGDVRAVVRRRKFDVPAHGGSSAKADLYAAMAMEAFPGTLYAGGYVYKETSPGYWSDHAYGDAYDVTPRKAPNDAVFDWHVRMGRAGEMDFDYALGSRNGNVVQTSGPDYDVDPSGASDSHLWHVHVSVIDHDGRKPSSPGGHG